MSPGTKVKGNGGGAIHRMFNEAQPAVIANKERQYRGKLRREQRMESGLAAKEGIADRRNGRSATRN